MILESEIFLDGNLFRNYSNNVRPVRNASLPVPVKLGLTLTQIFDMVKRRNWQNKAKKRIAFQIEKNQILITNVWLDQEW